MEVSLEWGWNFTSTSVQWFFPGHSFVKKGRILNKHIIGLSLESDQVSSNVHGVVGSPATISHRHCCSFRIVLYIHGPWITGRASDWAEHIASYILRGKSFATISIATICSCSFMMCEPLGKNFNALTRMWISDLMLSMQRTWDNITSEAVPSLESVAVQLTGQLDAPCCLKILWTFKDVNDYC